MDKALIESIVAEVMAKLSPVAAASAAPAPRPNETKQLTAQLIDARVVTASVLEECCSTGTTRVVVSRKAIVTPAALDWLKSRKISWERGTAQAASAAVPSKSWLIILQSVTSASRAAVDELRKGGYRCELVGQDAEATDLAVRALSCSEMRGAIVLSEQAERIVCLANRNHKVRAAVLSTGRPWQQIREMLHPNLVCIPVAGRTFVELRRTLRDCLESPLEVSA